MTRFTTSELKVLAFAFDEGVVSGTTVEELVTEVEARVVLGSLVRQGLLVAGDDDSYGITETGETAYRTLL